MRQRLNFLGLLLMLAACHRSEPLHATHAPANSAEPREISWFDGSLSGAFIAAKLESRPVLLYWGTEWCPECQTLKTAVFTRPDFISSSKLYLPVYLDVDDAANAQMQSQYGVVRYPTLLLLDTDGHELLRVGAGRPEEAYAKLLTQTVKPLRSLTAALQALAKDASPSAEDCRVLADNAWELEAPLGSAVAIEERVAQLSSAATRCPQEKQRLRGRLALDAVWYALRPAAAAAGGAPAATAPPAVALPDSLSVLLDATDEVLTKPEVAAHNAWALGRLRAGRLYAAVALKGQPFAGNFRDHYAAAMEAAASDSRYTDADHLEFLAAKVEAVQALTVPPLAKINGSKLHGTAAKAALRAAQTGEQLRQATYSAANQRIDSALEAGMEPNVRLGVVAAALDVLRVTDPARAAKLAASEIERIHREAGDAGNTLAEATAGALLQRVQPTVAPTPMR